MKHIYSNHEGELIAADSLEEAANWHDIYLGGLPEIESGWREIPDQDLITVSDDTIKGWIKTTKKAKDWASEFKEITQVATTYI